MCGFFEVTVRGQNHTGSFVDYLFYFLLLIMSVYAICYHQKEACIIDTSAVIC